MKLTNTQSGVVVDVPDALGEQLIAAGTYVKAGESARATSSRTRAKSSRAKATE